MISERNLGVQHLVLLCQCVLVTLCFWIWMLFSHYYHIDREVITRYIVYNGFVLLGLVMGSRRVQQTDGVHTLGFEGSNRSCFRRSFRQLGATLFYLLLYLVAAQDEKISRRFLFSFVPLLFLTLFATNRHLPRLIGHLTFRRNQKQNVLLVGPRHKALAVKSWLDRNKHLGLEVLGLLSDDVGAETHHEPRATVPQFHRTTNRRSDDSETSHWPLSNGNSGRRTLTAVASGTIPAMQTSLSPGCAEAKVGEFPLFAAVPPFDSFAVPPARNGSASSSPDNPLPLLGRPEDLEKLVAAPGLFKVIMVEFPRASGIMRQYTNLCESRGIRLHVVADIDHIFGRPVAVFEDQGLCLISLRKEPLENPINRFFKRCLDLAISVPVVLFILPPIILMVWILQRLHSPGPVIFRQTREGFQNQVFRILKFRTMHLSESANDKLPSSGTNPRVFPGGRFLRKTSLDEMPQFWNVMVGDMSVVGPRPNPACYNQQYREICFRAYVRTFVKPGITGLAQAKGFRGTAATPEEIACRMELDIEYLENWSLWLDCWLTLRTVSQMIVPPKSAA